MRHGNESPTNRLLTAAVRRLEEQNQRLHARILEAESDAREASERLSEAVARRVAIVQDLYEAQLKPSAIFSALGRAREERDGVTAQRELQAKGEAILAEGT